MRQIYELMPENVTTGWSNYPRPQFVRDSFYNLNGIWKVSGQEVLVPFCLQSAKSGFAGKVPEKITYEKHFRLPEDFAKNQVFLHFGAVDQIAEVTMNGIYLGRHEGGYLPFSFDVTDAINLVGENVLCVDVTDSLSHLYPYGKQKKRRGGMWYTPVSGIWQSVWMESVSENYVKGVKVTPDLKGINLKVDTEAAEYRVTISCDYNDYIYENTFENKGKAFRIDIDDPQLWTCEQPTLYTMRIQTHSDEIKIYFALRTVTIENVNGVNRICLNNYPIFLNGVLDQGYYCDGIFTPSNEEEYTRDILRMKHLGYNILRKHIKIEPEYFYYQCDKLGMLVLQDMVNNGHYSFFWDTVMPTFCSKKASDTLRIRSWKRKKIFVSHMKDTVKHLYNHPCIVGYTIFNEGWGQFDSDRIYDAVKKLDETRFIDSTSGWFKQKKSDVDSEHVYFKNIELKPEERPMLLSECGGFQYTVKGHVFSNRIYGYGGCGSGEEVLTKISEMYEQMVIPAMNQGLCGCIYTQLSDVEDEVNGLYTYDRKACKIDAAKMRELNQNLAKIYEKSI